ncbi:hypothetical protein SV7mr_06200 [Stieleria bergensis]|uniref:Lipoprotein n=1 Tax=Stieleria bergensis TaxID=2528025 RepID=A0A517SPT0_9BACT|nr:hypothetical protein SV7mr_06200 [Planctomycetes bacterium SV_7m_r]
MFPAKILILTVALSAVCLFSGCAPSRFRDEVDFTIKDASADSNAQSPTGFRRTADGWEDTTYWFLPYPVEKRSVGALMVAQQQRERGWLQSCLTGVRSTPPLVIAVVQIFLIYLLYRLHLSGQHSAFGQPRSQST